MKYYLSLPVLALVTGALCLTAYAQNATIAGEVTTPHPTIINLAIEWAIQGDDNLNGIVAVRYRAVGETHWREAMPLRRVLAGQSKDTRPVYQWRNKHSGSIFDLRPDTLYDIRLALEDPDGGSEERAVQVRTRPVPRAPENTPVRRVTPETIGTAKPGEILLLAAGFYGRFAPKGDGEPGRPIVYRSNDGGAVFRSISLRNRQYVFLEGLTVNGAKDWSEKSEPGVQLRGSKYCVVRRCKIKATWGIVASDPPGATNSYVADNIVEGISGWSNATMGSDGKNIGEGIQMTGSGNVICFNRVTAFRDNISTMEDTRVSEQVSVDIYNNDVYTGADDGIEADFCFSNCRVLRNRLTNCYVGVSSQPSLGGPTYFIRNAMYNLVHVPFKLQRWSKGDVVLHNTSVKVGDGLTFYAEKEPFDFTYLRNNLTIGGPTGGIEWGGWGAGSGRAVWLPTHGPHVDFDYDAVGAHQMPFEAWIGKEKFLDVEPHGVRVDMNVFENVEFPNPPVPERATPDLRPRAGSRVVDAGLRLPNINDDFLGKVPDIGAYEAGQPLPIYGPRPEGMEEDNCINASCEKK